MWFERKDQGAQKAPFSVKHFSDTELLRLELWDEIVVE